MADALQCQKKTAKAVVDGKGDYLLSVKGNQKTLETDISDYAQDPDLRKNMDTNVQKEKNRGRIEKRTAFVTDDVDGFPTGRRGQACAALARSIRSLKKRERKPVNGITISPAEN